MKKRALIILLISVLLSAAAAVDAFAYEKKDITAYVFDKDHTKTFHCISANDLPVPYVDVEEYLDTIFVDDFKTAVLNNGTYRIGSDSSGDMIVDPGKDTIHFDRFENFNNQDTVSDNGNSSEYCIVKKSEYRGSVSGCDFDLHKYGIDIIEDNNRVYLPLTTISDITAETYVGSVYGKDGENRAISIADTLALADPDTKHLVDYTYIFDQPLRDENEIKYTYNELCFVMDNLYGYPPKCVLAESIRKNGFDSTLENYSADTRELKRLLNSDKPSEYLFGAELSAYAFYDGGHTRFLSNWDMIAKTKAYKDLSDCERLGVDIIRRMIEKPLEAYALQTRIINNPPKYDAYEPVFSEAKGEGEYSYYEYDDTGIFRFTAFADGTERYFKKALDLAKSHGIKNMCIDVSMNPGGKEQILGYILHAMTGDNHFYYEGTATGNSMAMVMEFDMDLDHSFEGQNEDFDYDFNYAVLSSGYSFSCSNILSCYAKEAGIPILGEKSGGGVCLVCDFYSPNGTMYCASSFMKMLYKQGGDIEGGAVPDYDLTKVTADGKTDYSDFSNFELIDSILDKHYPPADSEEAGAPLVTVSDNKPMNVSTEERGDFRISYAHDIPFFGNSKITPDYFGGITVSYNNTEYKASAIKVNKKKHLMQITALEGDDKKLNKAIKKATKGKNGLPFKTNSYFVRNTDDVVIKEKKDGSAKSVKVKINDKYYKAKKDKEWKYDKESKTVTFSGENLDGSYTGP